MRIAVTSQGNSCFNLIDTRFRRAEYVMIYDKAVNSWEGYRFAENDEKSTENYRVDFLNKLKIDAVITGHIGPKPFKKLKGLGIPVYTASSIEVKEAVRQLEEGNLRMLAASNALDIIKK